MKRVGRGAILGSHPLQDDLKSLFPCINTGIRYRLDTAGPAGDEMRKIQEPRGAIRREVINNVEPTGILWLIIGLRLDQRPQGQLRNC